MNLPLFLKPESKIRFGLVFFSLATVAYLLPNRIHFSEPKLLHMTWIDLNVPLIPWTIFIYLSEYLFIALTYIKVKEIETINKYFYSFAFLQTVSCLIFFLWPTTFPRELYPLDPATTDFFSYKLFSSFRESDTPANCCPSLHVSSVYLISMLFLEEQKQHFWWIFSWATLIALSTLTTKQHYLIDVVSGLGFAYICYWIFFKKVKYHWISGRSNNRVFR